MLRMRRLRKQTSSSKEPRAILPQARFFCAGGEDGGGAVIEPHGVVARIGLLFELGDAATVGLAMHGGVNGGAGSACFYGGYGGFAVVSAVYEGARCFACKWADDLKPGLDCCLSLGVSVRC